MDISGAYHIIQTACPIIEPEEWAPRKRGFYGEHMTQNGKNLKNDTPRTSGFYFLQTFLKIHLEVTC
jgi:hypothetical protein